MPQLSEYEQGIIARANRRGTIYNPCACGCGAEAYAFAPDHVLPQHRQRWYDQLRTRAQEGNRNAFNKLYELGLTVEKPIMTGFGFEAEFYGISDEQAVGVLESNGFKARADGYHHDKRPYWRITEDGSVANEGLEMVSPILRVAGPSLNDARKAVTVLSAEGAVVNQTCGLHVHHSAHGMKLPDFIETVIAYTVWSPVISSLVPASRRDTQWGSPLSYGQRAIDGYIQQMTNAWPGRDRWNGIANVFDRYTAVNLQALAVHGTVEFRQHSGTLNPDKVEHWVRLTRLFMRSKRRGNDITQTLKDYDYDVNAITEGGVPALCDYLGTTDKTKEFYIKRAAELANYVEDDEDAGDSGFYCNYCGEHDDFEHDHDDY